jgi:N-methyl-L-tryptophan oxidase
MGTAAAWALAKDGRKALVLEQFQHVHDQGSHGGETRIIRHAYAESAEYVPLVQRADQLWQELEVQTGKQVLVRCGGLELAAPGYTHARAARASADEHGLPYEGLSAREVNARWSGLTVPEDWDALFSPQSGFLLTEPSLRAMATAAISSGATILEHAMAVNWGASASMAWVETPIGRFDADALIITAGAWASRMLGDLGLTLEVRRKTLWWQNVRDPRIYEPDRFPVFITDSAVGEIYGFPIYGTPGLKIANHAGGEPANADSVDRKTRPGENGDVLELASHVLPGVMPEVVKSAVCLYTVTSDADFIVDRHPEFSHVAIGAGFSGHGFKFAPAIGELLTRLVTEPTTETVSRLRLSRFERLPA